MTKCLTTRPGPVRSRLWWPVLLCLLLAGPAPAQETLEGPHTRVSLLSEVDTVRAGQPFWMAVRLHPDEGWHTYWRNPGDTGLPTRIAWELPAGAEAGPIQWPPPERIDYLGMVNFGYHGETLLLTRITPPADLSAGQALPVQAKVNWLVCKDVCIPASGTVSTTLTATGGPPAASRQAGDISAALAHLPQTDEVIASRFHIGQRLVVEISNPPAGAAAGDELQFFPLQSGIVDNSSAPAIHHLGDRLLISVPLSEEFQGDVPDDLGGLLVAGSGSQALSWQFSSQPSASPIPVPDAPPAGRGLLVVLLLAFVGGFILNLMPCVFPVLSIKVLSLIKSGQHEPRQRRLHGFAYTAGVLLSILAFAGVLLAVRGAGEAVGWGFQLQSPWFVAVLAYVIFVMGLSLSGVVEMGTSLTRLGNLLPGRENLAGSFFNGALATVVATPCTVPFMATALGFAMTQPAPTALLIFATLGLGLASPFLLIALFPPLANRLPKPGRWMDTLRQFLAFPLYFTVVWLLWVLTRQAGSGAMALVLTGMVLLVFALWLWRLPGPGRRLLPRVTAGVAVVAALALLPGLLTPVAENPDRRPGAGGEAYGYPAVEYSAGGVEEALAQDRPVFVNINADWCITCKVNERVALNSQRVRDAFTEHEVVYMVGDWTNGDETLSRLLSRFGRSGVPLYLLYRPGEGEPRVLPQLLTPGTVVEALEG